MKGVEKIMRLLIIDLRPWALAQVPPLAAIYDHKGHM